jgi:hypothetical protein
MLLSELESLMRIYEDRRISDVLLDFNIFFKTDCPF